MWVNNGNIKGSRIHLTSVFVVAMTENEQKLATGLIGN